jgi:hypothetical protein
VCTSSNLGVHTGTQLKAAHSEPLAAIWGVHFCEPPPLHAYHILSTIYAQIIVKSEGL